MIKIKNINISFDGNTIIENFSADIETNQHTCFVGSSGKGKSSILKLIQGYTIPLEGEVWINGKLLSNQTAHELRSQMAYIPQNVNLPTKNCMELSEMLGIAENKSKIISLLEELNLSESYYTKSIEDMSGGEKQRMIIALCISLDRKILLMDEPTSSLDDNSSELVINIIKKLDDTTIVSTSHNSLWLNNADKIINL